MKKVVIALFATWYKTNLKNIAEIKKFNNNFEQFIGKQVTGVDLTTVMNMALENNNKYEIEKDEKGAYKDDGKYSIQVIVRPTKNGDSYLMEAFERVGMKEFTGNFGSAIFQSTDIKYHENGRISKITFEIQS